MPQGADFTREVLADLRQIPTHVRREIAPALKRAAQPMLAKARANASWSSRIPRAIRISVLKRGVEIRVNARRAPHARPYEGMGNKGSFRHPVHGNRNRWVEQQTRPFLRQAVMGQLGGVRKELDDIVTKAARARGFR